MSKPNREKRALPLSEAEFRLDESDDNKLTLVGYAALWAPARSSNLGGFVEQIAPHAFQNAIRKTDTLALRDHNPSLLLGRLSNGTLRLAEDDQGLRFEIDLPNTTEGRDTAELVRRGDLNGCSFTFTTMQDSWDYSSDTPVRTLIEVDSLYDIGPVSYPAYFDTTVALRSLENSRPPETHQSDMLSLRLRLAKAR